MPTFGPLEWFIILVIVVVVFGAGRLGKIGGDLGAAIRNFRKGLSGDKDESEEKEKDSKPN